MMASSSGAVKVCFNSSCNQALEVPRQGWLCRTGDLADLCDRCASAFKDGKFCDTYHLNASGWRCCESCGKQIHCGCIVSFHMFILLDAGGIECLKCAKTEHILTPNPTWPSDPHFLHRPAEIVGDIPSKTGRSIAGSGPVPWRQAPSLFNALKGQPENQVTSSSVGQSTRDDASKRFVNDSWQASAQEMIGYKALTSGIQYDGQRNLFKDVPYQSFFRTNATPLSSLPATFVLHDQKIETGNVSAIHVKRLCTPPSVGKQCSNSNGPGPSLENQAYITKVRGETRACHQPLQRYMPQFTDQEFQQLSGGSYAKITPLFEKVLSASDASKIGRLVLPKKCAEAYLPPISQPEGYPLVVQDLNGKDWVLQYRFWLNNNSRMYVLEGVTPCIQSMHLQAGDTVTFGRLEPEGKLVMGFRKAPHASPVDKGNETTNTRISAHDESLKDGIACDSRNPDGTWTEVDKISILTKRKNGGKMCSNSKKLKLKEEEMFQISVTLEQLQGLFQPPLANAPTMVLIEGVQFEDFQDAPIIGSPTAFSTGNVEHTLPMKDIYHESIKTMESLDAPAELTHLQHQVRNSAKNPTQLMYADVICYTQMGNSNKNHSAMRDPSFENDTRREKSSSSTFKSQNIDLNMQPEREEEPYSVADSMGIMRLVQESTERYMKQHRLSINDITERSQKP